MSRQPFTLLALVRNLDEDLILGEALFFPETSRLGHALPHVSRALLLHTKALLERTPLQHRHRRHSPAEMELTEVRLVLPARGDVPAWLGELPVRFDAALWPAGGCHVAFLPALGIEVLRPDRERLLADLPAEIEHELRRRGASTSLRLLAMTQRDRKLQSLGVLSAAEVPTPQEQARRAGGDAEQGSVLKEVGDDLCRASLPEAYETESLVARLAQALSEPSARSVLLVGPPGVGKTALLHELVRRRREHQFGDTPFWATTGSRIVAGMSGFGMWQERCSRLRAEAARTRAVLHLGQLVELAEVGRGEMSQQGVAAFLRPFIARGELLCVAECTPQQVPLLERQDPQLLGAFLRLDVPEPAPETAGRILRREAAAAAAARKLPGLAGDDALDVLARLHRRYATFSAWPGRPLRFLRNLMADAQQPLQPSDVFRAFSRETGLPVAMLDEQSPLPLDEVSRFFSGRVLGQPQATELIVDLLATVKSGLARPRRPLASFLFVGPTGVGKTESAKALAEFLFGDRARMVRFDMSEYASPAAVQRLIGGDFGAEGLLTARVREQPFCVLLFDEFEKADPAFFDLLLQVLGEARLTDGAGRLADFSNAVVIMTSNLGAESFLQGRMGFGDDAVDATAHFTRALEQFVRPELLNRLDRVVPFLPLSAGLLRDVLQRELELLRRRAGLRGNDVTLDVTPEALDAIAEAGHQPGLGARPLKRALERAALVPLAEALNTRTPGHGLHAVAGPEGVGCSTTPPPPRAEAPAAGLEPACAALRRDLQAARRAPALLELANEIFRLERELARKQTVAAKQGRFDPAVAKAAARLEAVRPVLDAFRELAGDVEAMEDALALSAFGRTPQAADAVARLAGLHEGWQAALRRLLRHRDGNHLRATLLLDSPNHDRLFELGQAWLQWAQAARMPVRVYWFTREPMQQDLAAARSRQDEAARRLLEGLEQRESDRAWHCVPVYDTGAFLAEPREEPGLLGLECTGDDAWSMLRLEAGLHRFRAGPDDDWVPVHVQAQPGAGHELSPSRGGELPLRRDYDLASRQATDQPGGSVWAYTGSRLDTVLTRAVEAAFRAALERQVRP
ncbi:MAG: ATP-dependent Clp protease ATP-binding subunit [Planctomycetes bacterium]|nr:ATP-dependent Clp protease ATP-binding subunit [Planctomycetota bacterium]